MKRTFILVLAVALVLSMGIPAFASEDSVEIGTARIMTQGELEALAQEYFPEKYAQALAASAHLSTYSTNDPVVASETKEISDTESITFLQLNSGRASILHQVNFYNNSSTSGSGYTTVDASITMTVTGLVGVLSVNSLNYTIYTNGYDRINSAGNTLGSSNSATAQISRQTESSSGSATATYSMLFDNALTGMQTNVILQVYIGNNQRTYSVY